MKKTILLSLACVFILSSCNNVKTEENKPLTEAQNRAIQYAREIFIGQLSEIESTEVSSPDSVLSDTPAMAEINNYYIKKYEQHATKQELEEKMDDILLYIYDANMSSLYYKSINDSLGQLEKYENRWRHLYTVTFKMKSGTTHETKVVMDRDGKTPRFTLEEHIESLREQDQASMKLMEDFYMGN